MLSPRTSFLSLKCVHSHIFRISNTGKVRVMDGSERQRIHIYVVTVAFYEGCRGGSCQARAHLLRTLHDVLQPFIPAPCQAAVVSSDDERCWQQGFQKEQSKQASFVGPWTNSKKHFGLWMIKAWSDRLRMQSLI